MHSMMKFQNFLSFHNSYKRCKDIDVHLVVECCFSRYMFGQGTKEPYGTLVSLGIRACVFDDKVCHGDPTPSSVVSVAEAAPGMMDVGSQVVNLSCGDVV